MRLLQTGLPPMRARSLNILSPQAGLFLWRNGNPHSTPVLLTSETEKLSPLYLPQNGCSFPLGHRTVSSSNCRGVDRRGGVCHNPAAPETGVEVTPGKQKSGVWLFHHAICERKRECWLEVGKWQLLVHVLLLLSMR